MCMGGGETFSNASIFDTFGDLNNAGLNNASIYNAGVNNAGLTWENAGGYSPVTNYPGVSWTNASYAPTYNKNASGISFGQNPGSIDLNSLNLNTKPIYNAGMNNYGAGNASGANDLLGNLWKTVTSKEARPALLSAAGYLLPQPKSNIPSGQDLLAKYQNTSISPEGTASRAKLLEYINNPENIGSQATTDYIAALNADYDQRDKDEMAQFDSSWRAQGYNTTGSDYFKAKQDLMNKQALRRNTALGSVRQNVWQTQIVAQLQMISQAYGIDQQILTDLMTLDIQEASVKYGLDVEKVNQFRQAIYNMALMSEYTNQPNTAAEAMKALQPILGG